MAPIKIGGFSSIFVSNVEIAPDLLGATLSFKVDGRAVRLRIPSEDGKDYYSCDRMMGDVPVSYSLHRFHLWVELADTVDVPVEVIGMTVNQFDLIPLETQDILGVKVYDYAPLGVSIFERFLRVLRWQMMDGALGRLGKESRSSMTYLTDTASGHRIWAMGGVVKGWGTKAITREQWCAVESALQNSGEAPIYFDLLFDAEQHYEHGDLVRAVMDAGTACEVYTKERVLRHLPAGISKGARRAAEREHMPKQYAKLGRMLSSAELVQFNRLKSQLVKLFEARNVVAHTGKNAVLNDSICFEFLKAARALLTLGRTNVPKFHPHNSRDFKGFSHVEMAKSWKKSPAPAA